MCSACKRGALALLLIVACGKQKEAASAGSPPPIEIPVGPVPGPDLPEHTPNPWGNDQGARMDGFKLFARYNCNGCHGDHGGGGMGPSLRDDDWIYGKTDEKIFDSIAEGRAHGMPAWGVKIPDEQVWKLVAYITSLRTPDEPEPPPQAKGPMK